MLSRWVSHAGPRCRVQHGCEPFECYYGYANMMLSRLGFSCNNMDVSVLNMIMDMQT